MHVYEKRMLKNLNATGGLFNSEAVMLAAVKAGMEKDDAYTCRAGPCHGHLGKDSK